MEQERKKAPSRRNFLLAVGAGSVAAATAVMTGGSPPAEESVSRDRSDGRSYRLTGHIRNYYRTAQI